MGKDKNDAEAGEEAASLFDVYLLGFPGPSRLRRTTCHRLRPVTSHCQSSDFPEPDS